MLDLAIQQAEQVVGWDLHSMWDGPPWPVRVLILYLMGANIAALVILARVWLRVGLSDRRSSRLLGEIVSSFEKRDWAAFPDSLKKLSAKSPEGALRKWLSLPPEAAEAEFVRTLQEADMEFRYALTALRARSRSLITMIVFTWLLFLPAMGSLVENLVRGLWSEKISSSVLLGWAAHEAFPPFAITLWASLFLFLIYWHIYRRTESRRMQWEYFCSLVNQVLT